MTQNGDRTPEDRFEYQNFFVVVPDGPKCKHDLLDCARCGVHFDRDARHMTRDGRGVVARLRGKR